MIAPRAIRLQTLASLKLLTQNPSCPEGRRFEGSGQTLRRTDEAADPRVQRAGRERVKACWLTSAHLDFLPTEGWCPGGARRAGGPHGVFRDWIRSRRPAPLSDGPGAAERAGGRERRVHRERARRRPGRGRARHRQLPAKLRADAARDRPEPDPRETALHLARIAQCTWRSTPSAGLVDAGAGAARAGAEPRRPKLRPREGPEGLSARLACAQRHECPTACAACLPTP